MLGERGQDGKAFLTSEREINAHSKSMDIDAKLMTKENQIMMNDLVGDRATQN
jgi:hypothetical protein